MSKVIVEISPSVDGFVAGGGVSVERPFGTAGHRLHRWIGFEGAEPTEEDRSASEAMFATAGAVVIGRRMFDVGIGRWGADGAFERPTFVVSNRGDEPLERGRTTFHFVAGVDAALERAREAADGRDIVVAGGADIVQQCLREGAVDELRLHVVPVLLGDGTPLFERGDATELTLAGAVQSPNALHLTYRLTTV